MATGDATRSEHDVWSPHFSALWIDFTVAAAFSVVYVILKFGLTRLVFKVRIYDHHAGSERSLVIVEAKLLSTT